MHKLRQRSLPLDPTGMILETCCNSTGVIQTVCQVHIITGMDQNAPEWTRTHRNGPP